MLLRDLTIENYRSFDKYRLDNLARVNLLVGDNNCGKTSVLEAAYLLSTEGSMEGLKHLLELREDLAIVKDRVGTGSDYAFGAASLFCHGDVALDFDDLGTIKVTCENPTRLQLTISIVHQSGSGPARLEIAFNDKGPESIDFDGEGRAFGPWTGTMNWPPSISQREPMSLFVPASGLTTKQLAIIWRHILKNKREEYVTDALRVLNPSVERVHFSPDTEFRREILIDLNGERPSLAVMGGGFICLLSTGAALAAVKSGTLLIDEIDTGLHYSKLADMWKMVIQSAKYLDVQVFATTHSLDCLRALDAAVQRNPELAEDVAVHKIDRRTDHAARYGANELHIAIQHEVEVR